MILNDKPLFKRVSLLPEVQYLIEKDKRTTQDLYDRFEGENVAQNALINSLQADLDNQIAINANQDERIVNLEGINYIWSPTNRTLTLFDREGNQLSQVSLTSLDNEGTDLRYNATTLSLELYNTDNELLDSIPVSSFIGSVGTQLQLNSNQLQLKDNQGNVLSTVNFAVSNIQGLQTLLDGKLDKGTYTGTAQDLKNDIDNIQISGRNLILYSSNRRETNGYFITDYELSEDLIDGQEYVITFYGSIAEGKVFYVGQFPSTVQVTFPLKIKDGVYSAKFIFTKNPSYPNDVRNKIKVYNYPNGDNIGFIAKAKLEKGNKATDWTPAPEDKQDNLQTIVGNVGVGTTTPSEKLDVNGNVKATQIKDQYGTVRSQRVITITGNITLSEIHNGAILHITNTCNITIPTGLGANFACDCYVKGAFIATFVNSGVTLNSPSGLLLKTDKMATLYSNASDTFNLLGELATS